MSDSVRPHRRQPTRLPRPWDSPGKNTGVGCHVFLQCLKVKSESEVAQSCPTLCDPLDCSLPGSSLHGIFQARVLEWGAIAFSRLSDSILRSQHTLRSTCSDLLSVMWEGGCSWWEKSILFLCRRDELLACSFVCRSKVIFKTSLSVIKFIFYPSGLRIYFLLDLEMDEKSERVTAAQSWGLSDPRDSSPPCSSVHGILQARILKWVVIPFSKRSSWPRDWTPVSCIAEILE